MSSLGTPHSKFNASSLETTQAADLTKTMLGQEINPMATITVGTVPAPTLATIKAVHDVPEFDPARHMVGQLPAKKMSMKELGFAEDIGVSPVAVSEPFPLFTAEAVDIMRQEIFRVPDKYKFQSNIAKSQLRGYAKK